MLLRSQPFATGEARGLLSPDTLRGPRYTQLLHGARQPSEDGVNHGRRIQAFRKTHDADHVLLARSAAWALGSLLAAPEDPVVVAIRSHHALSRTRTVVPHLARLDDDDVLLTPLGRSTTPGRTAVDLARGVGAPGSSLEHRVAAVEALVRATSLSADGARAAAAGLRRLHGLPTARRVLDLVRDGVDSPPETQLRLRLVRAGLPEPSTQCPVVLGGRTVARLDLGWPEARVGCEYDGAVHLEPDQVRRDLRRHNLVREAGWVVLQVDRHQMRRLEEVVRQLRVLLDL